MVKLSNALTPRRPSSALRFALAAFLLLTIFYYLDFGGTRFSSSYLGGGGSGSPLGGGTPPAGAPQDVPEQHQGSQSHKEEPAGLNPKAPRPNDVHPIDELITQAEETFDGLMSRESKTVGAAATAYRARRGRHPPPWFEDWFNFAKGRKAVIVEEFFDQIYHDLEPFWGVEPARMRREAAAYEMFITVRDGFANTSSDWFWTTIWLDHVRSIQHLLPDMDIALNPMDEPRLIVPWEDMNGYMEKAAYTRHMERPQDVVGNYQALPIKKQVDRGVKILKKNWEKTKPYWRLAQRGCPPDSAARNTPLQKSFKKAPEISMKYAEPHLHEGFVANATLARDICHQPDLQGLNGIFIEPLSTSTTKTYFPMFGGSKLGINNEILLPAPMYWEDDERFTGGDAHGVPWHLKQDGVIWRGVATGGRNRVSNWKGFQRHRFVSMNNASMVHGVERQGLEPLNFAMPERERYGLAAQAAGKLSDWMSSWANVAFTDLMCEPGEEEGRCRYTGPFYHIALGVTMAQQFMLKYLPDIDGNSFSGRYLGFLRSTSLPIKATVWREWHDSRLVAWKHFVPMDSRFGDYFGIMEYFLGYGDERPAHDKQAERIASAGKEWAEKVLRREDMQIYTLRLLLEYARVSDDRRETMGWVNDLLAESGTE